MGHFIESLIHAKLTDKILEDLAQVMRMYFRIRVEGVENIPKTGKALVIANHSGFAGTDALMISHLLHRKVDRVPKILAHRAFFEFLSFVKELSQGFGLEETTVERGTELLKNDNLVLIFPEGEKGNFKSTWKRYRLQHFHTGFIRMAIQSQAPIVPCLVIGAEESHLNIGSVDLSSYLKGLRLPIPLSLVPLPAKWKIKFLPPLSIADYPPEMANDREFNAELSAKIQKLLQQEILNELRRRPYVYFGGPLRKRGKVRRKRALKVADQKLASPSLVSG